MLLILALSSLTTGSSFALGLGNASGQAILGAPLRIEIALIGSEAGIPAIDCFNLRPPQAEIASSYVLRNAQFQVLGEPGRARLAVTSSAPVQEPVVEFAVAIGCGFELSKDYLLLTEEPGRLISPVPPTAQPAATITAPSKLQPAQARPPAPASGESTLRIVAPLSLAALAQQKYPLQPKAREKFLRMMLLANPGLRSGEALIETGTELQVPPGLPLRREGSRPPAAKLGDAAVSLVPLQTPGTGKTAGAIAKPQRDRLVVGAAAERRQNPAELLAEAERLAAILVDQTKTQEAYAERIGKLDDTLSELKKHYSVLSDRLNRIEAERQAEKLAAKPVSLDLLELLLTVVGGGLIGALSLYLFNRRHLRRGFAAVPSSRSTDLGMPDAGRPIPPAKELEDFDLQWMKPASTSTGGTAAQDSSAGTPGADTTPSTPPAQNDFDFSLTVPSPTPIREETLPKSIEKASP